MITQQIILSMMARLMLHEMAAPTIDGRQYWTRHRRRLYALAVAQGWID